VTFSSWLNSSVQKPRYCQIQHIVETLLIPKDVKKVTKPMARNNRNRSNIDKEKSSEEKGSSLHEKRVHPGLVYPCMFTSVPAYSKCYPSIKRYDVHCSAALHTTHRFLMNNTCSRVITRVFVERRGHTKVIKCTR